MRSNDSAIKFTLSKTERLCSRKIIAGLYESGFFVSKYPIRINYMFTELPQKDIFLQGMVSVSKKKFSKAVDRNRIKRLLREVYRHRKHQLENRLIEANLPMAVAVIFTGTQKLDYWEMESIFNKVFIKLIAAVDEKIKLAQSVDQSETNLSNLSNPY